MFSCLYWNQICPGGSVVPALFAESLCNHHNPGPISVTRAAIPSVTMTDGPRPLAMCNLPLQLWPGAWAAQGMFRASHS